MEALYPPDLTSMTSQVDKITFKEMIVFLVGEDGIKWNDTVSEHNAVRTGFNCQ